MMTPTLRSIARAALFLVLCFTTTSLAQILSVSPTQNALNVSPNTSIAVTFNQAMMAATINDTTFVVWGKQSGLHKGTIAYNTNLRQATLTPSKPFSPGEFVLVALTNDIYTSTGQGLNKFAWQFAAASTISTGKFTNSTDYATALNPWSVVAADFDGDQDNDLAALSNGNNAVSILKNHGDGFFDAKSDFHAGQKPSVIHAADLDGDGDVDLAATNYVGAEISILKNNGDGTFQPRKNYFVGGDPRGLVAADLDGDGDLDLAVTTLGGRYVAILQNNGAGSFSTRQTYSVPDDVSAIAAADLDNDGDIDLTVPISSNSTLLILFNNSDGTFQPYQSYTVGGQPSAVFAADLDNDGDVDVGTANAVQTLSLLKNNGNGTFQPRQDYPTLGGGKAVSATDVDGDGDIDVAIANFSFTTVSILKNNGNGTFQARRDYAIPQLPYSIAAADLDGDGDVEVMTVNPKQNAVAILFNRNPVSATVSTRDFGSTYIGFPEDFNFFIYNESRNSANITTIVSSHPNFSIIGATSFMLAAGDSVKLTLRYSPTAALTDTGIVRIYLAGLQSEKIFVRGAGVPPSAVINVSPASLSFGNASLNTTADLILSLSNNGPLNLNISNMALGQSSFSLTGGNTHVIPPNSYKLIAVRLTPSFLGNQLDTLKIFSNDATTNPAQIPLSGGGVSNSLPEISAQPLELKFDSVLVKLSKNLTLRVRNRGAANLNISNVASNNNRFDILSAANFILAPGDSSDITIRFSPTQVGPQNGTLNITSNDANENPLAIKISGVGKAIPAPALAKIFPGSGNRLQTLDVGFKGANFVAGLTSVNAGANITVNSVAVQRPDSLTANMTIAATAATGPRDFFVTNPAPGGGSAALTASFTVNNPAPTLAKLDPAAGNRLQTLNVGFKGANFISGITAVNVGTNITVNGITVNRSDSMTVNLAITDKAALGARNVSVINNSPGGGISNTQAFTINNPAPALTSITPAKSERNQTLDVVFKGANFIDGVSAVNAGEGITVNSISVASSTNLTANLSITAAAATGSRNFSIANAGPGGGTSVVQVFVINNPAPTLTKITPNSGNLLQTLNVGFKGTNFISGVTSASAGPNITVNSVTVQRADSLTANITIGANALAGSHNFSATNSAPGGGTSGNLPFVVGKPMPALTSISPASGTRLQTLSVGFKGANFIDGVTSVSTGTNIIINAITVHRADSLTANVTINVNAVTGPRNFFASNGDGLVSASRVFTVNNPAPSLTKINPASGNRLQKMNAGFSGANFIGGITTVNAGPDIMVNNVVVNRFDSLTANITIAAEAAAGPRNFSVVNNGFGGGTSENKIFTVTNPAPTLTGLKPANGARLQTLNVGFKGSNFFSGATGVNAGAGIAVNSITVHRRDSLTANILIAANADPGPRNFSITNADPGGGTSTSMIFTVNTPAPTLTRINPASGHRLQTLNVGFKGTNFFSNLSSVNAGPNITVNGITVHRADSLTASLTIGANADLGPRNFSVNNGGASESRAFTVGNPAPTLTGIQPTGALRNQTLNVNCAGANFINKNTVVNVGLGIVINSIIVNSSTSLTANLTILPSAERGPRNFSVTNIAPGGGSSGDQFFMISNNDPTKPRLLSPANNQLIQLTRQAPPIRFLWSKSFDADSEDTLKYAINLKGAGFDTTFAAVKDTSVLLNIMSRLKANSDYSWDLRVSDGLVTVTWPDRATFRTSSTITAVHERNNPVPSEYRLEQNYPNPFQRAARYAETTIKYQLPKATFVTLTIFDVLGREMSTLVNAQQPPGYYNVVWNGKNSAGKFVPGGIYIYRLQAGNFERVMKMTVMR